MYFPIFCVFPYFRRDGYEGWSRITSSLLPSRHVTGITVTNVEYSVTCRIPKIFFILFYFILFYFYFVGCMVRTAVIYYSFVFGCTPLTLILLTS